MWNASHGSDVTRQVAMHDISARLRCSRIVQSNVEVAPVSFIMYIDELSLALDLLHSSSRGSRLILPASESLGHHDAELITSSDAAGKLNTGVLVREILLLDPAVCGCIWQQMCAEWEAAQRCAVFHSQHPGKAHFTTGALSICLLSFWEERTQFKLAAVYSSYEIKAWGLTMGPHSQVAAANCVGG